MTEHIVREDVYTNNVLEHQEKLRMDSLRASGGARSFHGTSKNGELREEAIPVIPVLEAPRQRGEWHLVGRCLGAQWHHRHSLGR